MVDITQTTDSYGFPIKLSPAQVEERKACAAAEDRELAQWVSIEQQKILPPEVRLKELVRKGVPPSMRSWVWMETSGAAKKKAAHAANYYQIMLAAAQNSPYIEEVEQDSARTFPDHVWIQSEEGQAALKRVLTAYSVHNDKIGYCRAMNCIAALLLIAVDRNEESAFWLLAVLVEDLLFPGTYAHNLEGCQVEMRALEELVATKLPKLHAHFQAVELDISILATDWYLCLFSTSLPSETVCRTWDALFNEGPKILFRVALALLKIYEENILRVDNAGEILLRMRSAASTMFQREVLMTTAFESIGGLPMATIDKYREMKIAEVEEMLRARGEDPSKFLDEAALSSQQSRTAGAAVDKAAEKLKTGFGKFMTSMTKLADKTAAAAADSLAKLKTKDSAGGVHVQADGSTSAHK